MLSVLLLQQVSLFAACLSALRRKQIQTPLVTLAPTVPTGEDHGSVLFCFWLLAHSRPTELAVVPQRKQAVESRMFVYISIENFWVGEYTHV